MYGTKSDGNVYIGYGVDISYGTKDKDRRSRMIPSTLGMSTILVSSTTTTILAFPTGDYFSG